MKLLTGIVVLCVSTINVHAKRHRHHEQFMADEKDGTGYLVEADSLLHVKPDLDSFRASTSDPFYLDDYLALTQGVDSIPQDPINTPSAITLTNSGAFPIALSDYGTPVYAGYKQDEVIVIFISPE